MRTRILVTLSAGAALSVGCGATANTDDRPLGNPPPQEEVHGNPPFEPDLPTWDQVPSGHPEGATNPPRPVLVVTPTGECYKDWVGSMLMPQPHTSDRVQDCSAGAPNTPCGTEIQCPDRAFELLAKWKAGETPGEKKDAP